MAFALGTTTGAGTITIAAGSTVVTGIGTNFQALNVGAIIVVGSQWGVIATRTSTTSITIDRPFATAVTASAYQISADSPVVNQTGTDTALTGLAAVQGVTTMSLGDATIYKILGMLNITGTLSFNGLTEKFAFDNQQDTAVGGQQRDHDIQVSGTLTVNLSTTVNGTIIYAPDFVYFSRRPGPNGGGGEHQLNATGSSFYVTATGTVNITGGTYVTQFNFACETGGRFNVTGANLKGRGNRFWMKTGSITTFVNAIIEGFSIFFNAFPTNISGVTFKNCTTITKEVSPTAGFDAAPNVVLSPQWLATASPIVNIWGGSWLRVKNSTGGSSLGVLNTAITPWASGIADFVQDVQFRVKNLAGANVTDFKFSAIESNDGNRRNVRQYTGVGPFYDNTDIRTLNWTSEAGGLTNTIEARLQAGVTTLTPTATPGSGGLVTTNFGQTANDEYDVFGNGYGYLIYQKRIQFRANGVLIVDETILPNTSITEFNPTLVAAYTTLNTNAQLYDYAAYYLFLNYARQTAFYITNDGDAGSYNVIINQLAATPFLPNVSSLAIKSANFMADLKTSGSVILANGSIISNCIIDAPNVIQDIPTNLEGVTITGNLTYNTNVNITITITNCSIYNVLNNGTGIITINQVNSTIFNYSDAEINFIDSSISVIGASSVTFHPTANDRDLNINASGTFSTTYGFKYGATINGTLMSDTLYLRCLAGDIPFNINKDIVIGDNLVDLGTTAQLVSLNAKIDLTAKEATLLQTETDIVAQIDANEVKIDAIKTKTDRMEFNAQNHLAANVHQLQAGAITSIQNGLSLEATSQTINNKVQSLSNYNDATAQSKLDDIKAKTDTLVNTDLSLVAKTTELTSAKNEIIAEVNANEVKIDAVKTKVDTLQNADFTTTNAKIDSKPTLAEIEASTVIAKEATSQTINTKVQTLSNYNDATAQGKLDAIKAKTDTLVNTDISTLSKKADTDLLLKATDYVAPDNTKISQIKTKVDTLENYDDTALEGKVDAIKTNTDLIPATI